MTEPGGEGHEELRDELAAYALGALPSEEAAQLERHLADCESCRDRLRWLQPAVDILGASVKQLTPPPELRGRLMETVRAEAVPPSQEAAATRAEPRGRRWGGWGGVLLRPATAFVSVVLIAAGVAAGYALRGDDGDSTTTIAAEPASHVEGDVSADLLRQGDNGALHVHEMPAIARDEVYEVWVQRGDGVEPASTFVLNRDGSAVAAVPGLEGADAVLVTREPYGGSEQPTTRPVLEAALN